jgi:hypothetical protein
VTKQQKIGSAILISVFVLGIIFKFFNPIYSLIFLAVVVCAICGEIAESEKPPPPPSLEDIRKKYPKRKSQEQLRRESEKRLEQERFKELERQQLRESMTKEMDLLALVRDRNTCERLLRGLRRKYPNETRLWIIEKAISDIERDRRV